VHASPRRHLAFGAPRALPRLQPHRRAAPLAPALRLASAPAHPLLRLELGRRVALRPALPSHQPRSPRALLALQRRRCAVPRAPPRSLAPAEEHPRALLQRRRRAVPRAPPRDEPARAPHARARLDRHCRRAAPPPLQLGLRLEEARPEVRVHWQRSQLRLRLRLR
jgi:hypothetical protein